MYKLNSLYKAKSLEFCLNEKHSLDPLQNNIYFEEQKEQLCKRYNKNNLKTISFSKEGILSLLLNLKGTIAVSLGESEAIVQGALLYKSLGYEIDFIYLNSDGSINFDLNKEYDYIFLSSYVMDTFVKVDIQDIKNKSNAKIISNVSCNYDNNSDVLIFDSYKLTSYGSSALVLFNDEFDENYLTSIDICAFYLIKNAIENQSFEFGLKEKFQHRIEAIFKEDMYYFVESKNTLEYTLHIGLKNLKARELIRSLALSNIFISNGEGCSLGLSKPSRIIQEMGYEEEISRNSICLSFGEKLSDEQIDYIVNEMYKKYKQIRLLNEQ